MGCCDHTARCSASSPIALISPTLIKHRLADYKVTLSTNQVDPFHEGIREGDYRKGGGD